MFGGSCGSGNLGASSDSADRLRFVRRVFLLSGLIVLALAVIALIVVAPWDSGGGESHDKPALLEHISEGLRSRGAPQQYIRCITARLDRGLTDKEVKRAYDELPSGAGGAPGLDLRYFVNPETIKKFRTSGIACARQLVASGEFTPHEVITLLRGLASGPSA